MASLWHHNCIRQTLYPIGMKNFEDHPRLNCNWQKKLMSSVTGLGSHVAFLHQNLQIRSPIWNQTRSLQPGLAAPAFPTTDGGPQCQTWDQSHLPRHIAYFNMVWHHTLLTKLSSYGIQGNFHSCRVDFLSCQSQCVSQKEFSHPLFLSKLDFLKAVFWARCFYWFLGYLFLRIT